MVELIPMSVAISGPLKQQWGYLFVDDFGSTEDYRTLSHELGHGRTALQHTFKDDYIAKYTTNNLMDYVDPGSFPPNGGSGWEGATDLVRAQWDMVHNPAIFTPLQSDGDGADVGFAYAENGVLTSEPINIESHTFFTPAGYPITFNSDKYLFITTESFESKIIDSKGITLNITAPVGALCTFNYDGDVYKGNYKINSEGVWNFEGYRKYIKVDDKLVITNDWYIDEKLTANLPNTYKANIWQTDPKKVLQQVDCDWQIDCLQLFPEGTSNYMGAGTLVSAINPTPIQDLKDKYAPLFSSSPALTTAINNNPCALYGMRSIGEGLGFETQFMKGMNTFVTVGLAAALFPAVWEIMGVQALSSLSAKQAADISVNMAINTTFQTIIAYYFELPRDERTWKLALEQVDAGEVLLEIPKALIDKWYADLAIACAYSGFKEGDITSLDFDCKKCAEGVVEELAGMVFSGLIKSGSKYFIRLAKAARTTPDHFIDGLTEVADIDLTLDAANKVELINKLEVADVPNIQAYKKFLQVDWETLDKYTSNSWDMAEAKWGNASVLMNQDVPGIRYRKVSDALQVKHKDGKYLVYDTESNSLVRYIEKEGDEITDFSKEIFDNYNPDDDVARMFEVGYKEDLGTAPLSQIETHDVAKFDAYVDAGYTPKQQQLDAQYRAKMKDAPAAKNWKGRKIGENPLQNTQVQKLCEYLKSLPDVTTDIRINQRQVDIHGKYVGINRPDLQFTYKNKRYYVEWDTKSSNRGPIHELRIRANDLNLANYNVAEIPSELKNIDLGNGDYFSFDKFVQLKELGE